MNNSKLEVQRPLSYVISVLPHLSDMYKMLQVFSRSNDIIADGLGSFIIIGWKPKGIAWIEYVGSAGIYR